MWLPLPESKCLFKKASDLQELFVTCKIWNSKWKQEINNKVDFLIISILIEVKWHITLCGASGDCSAIKSCGYTLSDFSKSWHRKNKDWISYWEFMVLVEECGSLLEERCPRNFVAENQFLWKLWYFTRIAVLIFTESDNNTAGITCTYGFVFSYKQNIKNKIINTNICIQIFSEFLVPCA